MRDYIWPRCPSGWNGEERQFFRALIEVLQLMGQPITEKDLSKKLLDKINNGVKPDTPDTPDTPETPETPEQEYMVLYDNGFVDGVEWTVNTLPREGQTTMASTYLSGNSQFTIYNGGTGTNNHNAHYITKEPIVVPKNATTMNIETHILVGGCGANFGLLPADAPTSVDTSNGGQLSGYITVDTGASKTLSITLDDSVKGTNNLYAVINGRLIGGRRICFTKVWFE